MQCINETMWDLIEIYIDEDTEANAQTLFEKLIFSFDEENIPLNNIIAFCSDTCNLMMGKNNGLSTKLQKKIPFIEIIKCNCHIEHLCARYAMECIPKSCEQLVSSIYNYIHHGNGKRNEKWLKFQKNRNLDPLNALKPGSTRWLSLSGCVSQFLGRWTALLNYFEKESLTEKSAKSIHHDMSIPLMKVYFYFLEHVLSTLTHLNLKMQSTKSSFNEENEEMIKLYKKLLYLYMNENFLSKSNIREIDPLSTSSLKPINKINIGLDAVDEIKKTNIPILLQFFFYKDCQNFLRTSCNQLKSRLDFNLYDRMNKRIYLHPKNVINKKFHEDHKDFNDVINSFPSLVDPSKINLINNEWKAILEVRNLSDFISDEDDIDTFWVKVLYIVDENEDIIFKNIAELAINILLFPNSNASVERLWSKLNLEKTKLRCKLLFSTLRSILLSAYFIRDKGGVIYLNTDVTMIFR